MNNYKIPQLLLVACVFALVSCNSKNDPGSSANMNKATDSLSYPYKATYSSDVSASSHPEYAQTVLTVWKMFESNKIDSMKQYYADTVTYEDASGFRFHGRSDSLLNFARKDNEGLDSLRFDISMWQNLHINDKNEDWVYIWAAERRYPKKGKPDTSLIHEQWQIVDGKVAFFNQYKARPPVQLGK